MENNAICYPLAKLGYRDEYFITEQGKIIDRLNQSELQLRKNGKYRLKKKDGTIVYRSIKPLYRSAFGKEYSQDNIKDLPEEKWKPIDEKGKYFVSSLGRVKSYQGQKAKLLKPFKNQSGYQRVDILLETRRTYLVHQLVAQAFIINDAPEEKNTVDHIDGNKNNNAAGNLRWLSRGDNVRAYIQLRKGQ